MSQFKIHPLPHRVIDPATGIEISYYQVVKRFAVEHGLTYTNKKGYTVVNRPLLRAFMHRHFDVPNYEKPVNLPLAKKVHSGMMIPIYMIPTFLGLPSYVVNKDLLYALVKWLFDRKVPVYAVADLEVVLTADVMIALESVQAEQDGTLEEVWRNVAARGKWSARQNLGSQGSIDLTRYEQGGGESETQDGGGEDR